MNSKEIREVINYLAKEKDDSDNQFEEFDNFIDEINKAGYKIVKKNDDRKTNLEEFKNKRDHLHTIAREIQESKNAAYNLNDEDYHNNFRIIANMLGVDEMVVWAVYYLKHVLAVMTYAKDPDVHQPEPLDERFADIRNYTEFGFSMYKERQQQNETEDTQ